MALANLFPSNDNDSETNCMSAHIYFGTDNCATHHICSDYNLFVKSTYRLIKSVGVQGIAGKEVAKGMSTVVIIFTDDDASRSTIILDNGIHLLETSKNLISIS